MFANFFNLINQLKQPLETWKRRQIYYKLRPYVHSKPKQCFSKTLFQPKTRPGFRFRVKGKQWAYDTRVIFQTEIFSNMNPE